MVDTFQPTAAERFRQLQNQLREWTKSPEEGQLWQSVDIFDRDDYDILVIPSFSVDQEVGNKVAGFLHYEERLLFSLIRLRNPLTRVIYITALPLCPIVIDYYLQLLPGIPFSHARDRLLLISTYDGSLKPLTQKILERPRLVEKIRRALRPNKSYMVCYNSTHLEQKLSLTLGIPLLAASPEVLYWGSKSGSREIFAEAKIPHPDGSYTVENIFDLVQELLNLWQRQPDLQRIVVKLNEGFSGEGNAILDLRPIQDSIPDLCDREKTINALNKQLECMSFQGAGETWSTFSARIPELGAIVEAFVEGDIKRSPSVQGYIRPSGEVEIVSTHDQILGGADGQVYEGCYFPADASYRYQLQELGLKVGEVLASKGAIERYSVDFIAVQQPDQQWDIQAIEINLRKGGTTHPFMTLRLLTNGTFDYDTGKFLSQQNQEKHYIATDNLQKDRYRGLLPNDLMDIIAQERLHFDSSSRTGTVFHLMGALSEFGKLGLTSIGNSLEEAQEIYDRVEAVLDRETEIVTPDDCVQDTTLPINWSQ
ncbi:carboxylate-amine ligase [Waterburya agarophytonicola K14]|uniref:Carboxylate-amine ligase n=1 Tax=Waterburya agarophytonicola KI4 TaxID=2874699 RepID=A0A964FG97_9CYAN|nr:peptide ligase PGM1-related protein [Waterburya agarophytonicola]MCC0178645.1 carboxylate-amine ligase [Waterburya agarophytonicola KI4]